MAVEATLRASVTSVPDAAHTNLAPDWVCEMLSPSTERIDRSKKLPIHAREGVRHLWLIDPGKRQLEALELGDGTLHPRGTWTGDATVRAPPFHAEPLPLAELWVE